ncbi:hypothetical protein D9M72_479490 [compost metagenome]
MIVGNEVAVFGDEEARTLRRRTQATFAMRATATRATALGTVIAARAEFLEEALQRVIIRQVVEAATVKIEGEVVALFGNRIDARLDADRNDGRRNRLDDVGKARHRRCFHLHRFSEGLGDARRQAGGQHDGSKAGNRRGLQNGLEGGTLGFGRNHPFCLFSSLMRPQRLHRNLVAMSAFRERRARLADWRSSR